jgi:hypothetical protein
VKIIALIHDIIVGLLSLRQLGEMSRRSASSSTGRITFVLDYMLLET